MNSAETTSCKNTDTGEVGKNHCTSNGCASIELPSSHTLSAMRYYTVLLGTQRFTKPQIYPRSLRDTFLVSGLPAEAVSSMSSSALRPTRATPLRTPIVAGIPPFTRISDSRWEAKAMFSGYGKPALGVKQWQPDHEAEPVPCVYIVVSKATTGLLL